MKSQTLPLQRAAKLGARSNVDNDPEDLVPVLLILTAAGIDCVGIDIEDKDVAATVIHRVLTEENACAYSLVMEAWETSFIDSPLAQEGRVRDMPADDRREVVSVHTVERDNPETYLSRAVITRLEDGTRRLGDWEDEVSELAIGRFVITDW